MKKNNDEFDLRLLSKDLSNEVQEVGIYVSTSQQSVIDAVQELLKRFYDIEFLTTSKVRTMECGKFISLHTRDKEKVHELSAQIQNGIWEHEINTIRRN